MKCGNDRFVQKFGKYALFTGAIVFALAGVTACSNPSETDEDSHVHEPETHMHDDTEEPAASEAGHGHPHEGEEAHAEEMDEEHSHEHAEDEDHAHSEGENHDHAEDDHDDEIPEDAHDIMDAIASTHETIETAKTDEEVIDIHHAPYEIVELFEALREKVDLSEDQAAEYDKLLARIDKTAGLIDDHAHEEDVAMVRNLIERINGDIEALEKVAMPDHQH